MNNNKLQYTNVGSRQISHATEILPQLISALLREVPTGARAGVLRRALNIPTDGCAIPISTLFPRGQSQQVVSDIWNGFVSLIMALGAGSPSDSVSQVLSRAASISSGMPMSGDPAGVSDVPLAQAVATLSTIGGLENLDKNLATSLDELARYYDCAVHHGYLGGSVSDGIRMIGQEIAGLFSTKKDLQGDYTRAKYRYERDTTDPERLANLQKAANTLVVYLRENDPDDDLLKDEELLSYTTLESGTEEEIQADIDEAHDAIDAKVEKQTDDAIKGDLSGSDPGSVQGGASARPIQHTADAQEVRTILSTLLSQATSRRDVVQNQAAVSAIEATRLSAAWLWMVMPDTIVAQLLGVSVPTTPTTESIFSWCVAIAQTLASLSKELSNRVNSLVYSTLPPPQTSIEVSGGIPAPANGSTARPTGLIPGPAQVDKGESVDAALSGVTV